MSMPKLTLLEDRLWVVEEKTGLSKYDFELSTYFKCRHPAWLDAPVVAIARMGAAPDYGARYRDLEALGITLIHTPEVYERTSLLPCWYPLIEGLTPESWWFDALPSVAQIEARLSYPIFIKGERQTNKHSRDQSIIMDRAQLERVLAQWSREPILSWQRLVCREYLKLRPVSEDLGGGLPHVYELRTFWWRGQCVGMGPYWSTMRDPITAQERADVLALGAQVCQRLDATFLVVDVAQTQEGRWVVIECNDGQDSGYMGVDRLQLWRRILDIEASLG